MIDADDPFLQSYAFHCIQKKYSLENLLVRSVFVESQEGVDLFMNELRAQTLFSEKKLVKIFLSKKWLAAKYTSKIIALLEDSSVQDVVVLTVSGADAAFRKRKFYEWFAKYHTVLQLRTPSEAEMPQFIQRLSKHYGISFDREALHFFVMTYLNNLGMAIQRIIEFKEVYQLTHLDLKNVEYLVSDSGQLNNFSVVEVLLSGQANVCFRHLSLIARTKFDYLLFIGLLRYHFVKLKIFFEIKGDQHSHFFKSHRIFNRNMQDGYIRMKRSFSNADIQDFMTEIQIIEYSQKGLLNMDTLDRLEQLFFKILYPEHKDSNLMNQGMIDEMFEFNKSL